MMKNQERIGHKKTENAMYIQRYYNQDVHLDLKSERVIINSEKTLLIL